MHVRFFLVAWCVLFVSVTAANAVSATTIEQGADCAYEEVASRIYPVNGVVIASYDVGGYSIVLTTTASSQFDYRREIIAYVVIDGSIEEIETWTGITGHYFNWEEGAPYAVVVVRSDHLVGSIVLNRRGHVVNSYSPDEDLELLVSDSSDFFGIRNYDSNHWKMPHRSLSELYESFVHVGGFGGCRDSISPSAHALYLIDNVGVILDAQGDGYLLSGIGDDGCQIWSRDYTRPVYKMDTGAGNFGASSVIVVQQSRSIGAELVDVQTGRTVASIDGYVDSTRFCGGGLLFATHDTNRWGDRTFVYRVAYLLPAGGVREILDLPKGWNGDVVFSAAGSRIACTTLRHNLETSTIYCEGEDSPMCVKGAWCFRKDSHGSLAMFGGVGGSVYRIEMEEWDSCIRGAEGGDQ